MPSAATPTRVRLRVYRPPPGLCAGDRLCGRAPLAATPPPVIPSAFDFQRNAFSAGIGATGVMIFPPTRMAGAGAGLGNAIADLLARAAHRIADRLPGLVHVTAHLGPDSCRLAGASFSYSDLQLGLVTSFVFFLLWADRAQLSSCRVQ